MSSVRTEKIEYHTQFKKVERTDPLLTVPLLSVKHESPPSSSSSKAAILRKHKRCRLPPNAISSLASSLMGPGPWTLSLSLPPELVDVGRGLLPSNKNKRSNVTISHLLKCVIRVERGELEDDDAQDEELNPDEQPKRKLFDIVVQTPIQILSVSVALATLYCPCSFPKS
ncbi:hypothetical protein C8R42DRAFT_577629 [Lentinula raphanica]|nr:hypothetical protein C8R42DRAFT_577629 [Lentinula raphanica]